MLSLDNISYSFDSRANDYARDETIANLIVKSLLKIIINNNTIRAIIRDSDVN